MSDANRPRITQNNLRQNNVVVKDQATHSPDLHPIDQELHILGQPGRVWCGILSPRGKNSPGSCCNATGATEANFSASNWAYCWSD